MPALTPYQALGQQGPTSEEIYKMPWRESDGRKIAALSGHFKWDVETCRSIPDILAWWFLGFRNETDY
jgi:hypothetical protein